LDFFSFRSRVFTSLSLRVIRLRASDFGQLQRPLAFPERRVILPLSRLMSGLGEFRSPCHHR
jgi:hypothetical protein